MNYEWDEGKRAANIKRHGIDFVNAPLVYEYPGKLTVDGHRGGEVRKMDIATVRDITLTLIYTERSECVRIISFRRASRKERRHYDEYQRIS